MEKPNEDKEMQEVESEEPTQENIEVESPQIESSGEIESDNEAPTLAPVDTEALTTEEAQPAEDGKVDPDIERLQQLEKEVLVAQRRLNGSMDSLRAERAERVKLESELSHYRRYDKVVDLSEFDNLISDDFDSENHYSLNDNDSFIGQAERSLGLVNDPQMQVVKYYVGTKRWKAFLKKHLDEKRI